MVASSAAAFAEQRGILCGPIFLEDEVSPPLTSMELRLICGDKEGAWATLPLSQAEYTLRSYLKDRGHHYPTFKKEAGGQLSVALGPVTRVTLVQTENLPSELKMQRKGQLVGEALTPKLLKGLDRWVMSELQHLGYPCPFVRSEGDPKDGHVLVKGDAGKKLPWIGYTTEGLPLSEAPVVARYRAFSETYDSHLVELTESRLIKENVFLSARFRPECGTAGVLLEQEAVVGSPRTFRVGAGINTESIFIGRASWQNSRMGSLYSSVSISAFASGKEQSFKSLFDGYFFPSAPKLAIQPSVELRHENELGYEDFSLISRLGFRTFGDSETSWTSLWIGPGIDVFETVRGTGLQRSRYLQLIAKLTQKSHDYEYYAKSPRSGYQIDLSLSGGTESVFSTSSVGRAVLDGKFIFDFGGQDPPPLVLGARFLAGTVWASAPLVSLVSPYLFYLGGSSDLRGFARRELPKSGVGAATLVYGGLELRVPSQALQFNISNLIPLKIEPILFVDVGWLGAQSLSLDSTAFWSPGLGTRWTTPIGLLRMTLAAGFRDGTLEHFQYFLSLGEEF